MAKKRKCVIQSCDNEATPKTNYCHNCGAGINRWAYRRPAERVEYRTKLGVRSSRMDVVLDEPLRKRTK